MHPRIHILPALIVAVGLGSCSLGPPKMVVENRSGVALDSVVLVLFGKPVTAVAHIPPDAVVETELPKGALSSGHDLAVDAYGKIGEKTIGIDGWFTDLGAHYSEARIRLEPGKRGRITLR